MTFQLPIPLALLPVSPWPLLDLLDASGEGDERPIFRRFRDVSPTPLEVRRTLLDLLRHHFGPEGAAGKHFSDVGQGSSGHGGVLQNEPDRSDPPETLESWAQFHEAMDRLPAIEREVFQLNWYGGLEQKDIASVLGISVPTVQRRLYRARHLIRAALEGVPSPLREHKRHE